MSVGDNLPTQICALCAQKVDGFYDFKLQCERSDAALRQYLKEQNSPAQPVKVIMLYKATKRCILRGICIHLSVL
jgi:hypothetical protein